MSSNDEVPRMLSLGEYIRVQRQMADLSLRGLAELAHVSNAYLSQIERGLHQPSIRVLRSIAEALDLSTETLLSQAGLSITAETRARDTPSRVPGDTEAAIRSDPDLTPEARDALLTVYRTLKNNGTGA